MKKGAGRGETGNGGEQEIALLEQRISGLQAEATASVESGRSDGARAVVGQLRAIDDRLLARADPAVTRKLLDIAALLLPIAPLDDLAQFFLKGMAVLRDHSRAQLADRFTPLFNLGVLYDQMGDNESRDSCMSQIVQQAAQLEEPLDTGTAVVFAQLADIFDRAAIPQASSILRKHLHRLAVSGPALAPQTSIEILARYCSSLSAAGESATAVEICDRSLQVWGARGDFGTGELLQLHLLLGEHALANGDLEKAQSSLERGRQLAEQSELRDAPVAGYIYHNLAASYLRREKREKYDEAEALLRHAAEIVAATRGTSCGEYAGEVGQLAGVAVAKGENDRAADLYRQCIGIYEAAPDSKHQDYIDFLADAAFLSLRLRRPEEALALFARAAAAQEAAGMDKSTMAAVTSNLALAQFECGNFAEASRLYNEALLLRHPQ